MKISAESVGITNKIENFWKAPGENSELLLSDRFIIKDIKKEKVSYYKKTALTHTNPAK